MQKLNETYWSQRYDQSNTPWDIGYAAPALTAFFQNLVNKKARILIPGAGNAYEAEWLWKNGYENTYVIDLAKQPLKNLQKRLPDFPAENLIHKDFFELHASFDLIVEQTFFCALNPDMREAYARKMADLLAPTGQLVGVLFDFELTSQGPPFGGSYDEYRNLFTKHFRIKTLERCYNSIKPRQGNELFIHLLNTN